jgi:Ca2+-binding EF-hand superfamily protein
VRGSALLLDLGKTRTELRGGGEEGAGDPFAGIIRQQLLAQFRQADKDRNGYLDRAEAKARPFFRDRFDAMDRDGDGKLYEKEVIAYLDAQGRLQKRLKASCVTVVLSDESRGLFDLLDSNRDGRLSVRELRAAPGLLKQLGCEKRGYLTKVDVPSTHRLTLRRGPASTGELNQGAVFAALYGGGYKAEVEGPTAGPLWFRKMDRNRDGDVSRKEWLFSAEKFREIDTDGDGLISLAEAEAYEARRRKAE